MPFQTLLVIGGVAFPYGAGRGITQTLEPISAAFQARRTINGELVDLSLSQFQKYRSTVTCTDQVMPTLDGLWPGAIVQVDCALELAYATSGGSPSKSVASTRVEGDYTHYRPRLQMMVTSCPLTFEEWTASSGWTISLEEV